MKCAQTQTSETCGHLLVKASRLFFSKTVEEITSKYKLRISEPHFRVFPYLQAGGATISDISKKMKISKQAVSKLVHHLVDENILRFDSTSDGRQKLVSFETSGKSSFGKSLQYMEEQDAVFEKVLGSPKDLEAFKHYLLKIQNHYEMEP